MESPARVVLLVADEGSDAVSLVHAMKSATIEVEWSRSLCDLRTRKNTDGSEPALVIVDLELRDTSAEALLTLVLDGFPISRIVALGGDLTGQRGAQLLSQGVPSLPKPVCPHAMAALCLRLLLDSSREVHPGVQRSHLETILILYSLERVLSKQQQMILRLYLGGMNDKGIAEACNCSEATVYEHWRRMARKAGGSQKSDAIADFHRFLAGD